MSTNSRAIYFFLGFALFLAIPKTVFSQEVDSKEKPAAKQLNVLFIGNSYTARHNLSSVVEQLAENGNPNLDFVPSTVIYGGRTLSDHWRFGTQHVLNRQLVSKTDVEKTLSALVESKTDVEANNPKQTGNHKKAITNNEALLKQLESKTEFPKWDIVILQSYRDDLNGSESLYAKFAPKYAAIAKEAGVRVILYETTPTTQNATAITSPPDPKPIMKKANSIVALANQIGAKAAPMSLAGLRCQTERPDLTLRFINDAHLNQTLSYVTACTLYAAIFDKSPQGLEPNSVTDIRFLDDENRDKDRDGNPITKVFSDKDRAELQRIAWETYQQFEKMRTE